MFNKQDNWLNNTEKNNAFYAHITKVTITAFIYNAVIRLGDATHLNSTSLTIGTLSQLGLLILFCFLFLSNWKEAERYLITERVIHNDLHLYWQKLQHLCYFCLTSMIIVASSQIAITL